MITAFEFVPTQVRTASSAPLGRTHARTADTETLVRMIRTRSEAGFTLLYDRYSVALYSILFRIVKRKDLADDLLQDSFVKIWKHIDGFDPGKGTLFTWMLNIARNLAIDHLRSSSHRNQLLHMDLACLEFKMNSAFVPEASPCAFEQEDFKNKALQLDPKCAEVIDMTFFYGWSHAQTAEILELPLGTVKSRSRKALRMLKILYAR